MAEESRSYPDPHGYGRRCEESDCSLCRDAGLEWKSGFCSSGCWSPKPVATAMDPDRWSKLPRDILGNIFARLPTDGIGRVRCLSKEWRVATSSPSKFSLECAKFQPNLWALIGFREGPAKTCWVRAYDSQAGKWHGFEIESIPQLYRNAIRVFDGGLGCFVPCGVGEDHQPVLVCNPLTGEWKQLPLSRLVGNQPRMAQLRVNREKGTYKVIVVGHVGVAADLKHRWEDNNPLAAEVYDSERKAWSALESGKVLGFTYWWYSKQPIPMSMRLGVYDCSTGVLSECYEQEFPRRPYRNPDGEIHGTWGDPSFANHVNELYSLESHFDHECGRREESGLSWYNVSKHEEGNWGLSPDRRAQVRTAPNEVVELQLWKCGPGSLRVCRSFFLLIGNHVDRDPGCERVYYLRLYDREKKKWLEEFAFEGSDRKYSVSPMDLYEFGIGELRWDACP